MKILKISDELSKRYLQSRDSYETAKQALSVSLPELKDEELHQFYVNAFRDLCDTSVQLCIAETEILTSLNISGFEKIELNNVYTMEDEHDN